MSIDLLSQLVTAAIRAIVWASLPLCACCCFVFDLQPPGTRRGRSYSPVCSFKSHWGWWLQHSR